MNLKRYSAVILTTLTATAALMTGTAQAAEARTCDGTISGQRVRADLVVEDGKTCTITNSKVQASITVKMGSTLVLSGSTVTSDVRAVPGDNPWAQNGASLQIRGSRVHGLLSMDAHSTYAISNSRINRIEQAYWIRRGPVGTIESSTVGSIKYSGGLTITGSTITGDFATQYGLNLTISDSTVRGTTTANGVWGTKICGSRFQSLTVAGPVMGVDLGDGGSCAGNQIRGDLSVNAMQVIHAYGNTVRGKTTSPAGPLREVTGPATASAAESPGYSPRCRADLTTR